MKKLSKSIEDYIEAIYMVEQEKGEIKSIDIANKLNVSKPAVNRAMTELNNLNFIEKGNYTNINLTEEGRKQAKNIYQKHILIYKFLLDIGVSEENASLDCCKIEHVISDETIKCIQNFLNKNKSL